MLLPRRVFDKPLAPTQTAPRPAYVPLWIVAALTFAALAIHGYHPLAEDGGLYVAGIELRLDPTLFPHDRPFVAAHLAYSVFAPLLAAVVRRAHLPLLWTIGLAYVGTLFLTLFAVARIAALALRTRAAAIFATTLFTCWLTLPIAGTSLLLADPYLTARSFSLPLALLALYFSLTAQTSGLTPTARKRAGLIAFTLLVAAATFHPLMSAYAAAFIVASILARVVAQQHTQQKLRICTACLVFALAAAAAIQAVAPPEDAATTAASFSRYYWFLSQWQWYEILGLVAPLALLWALTLHPAASISPTGIRLAQAAIATGLAFTLIAALFAQQHYATHLVARLQPLRSFQLIYITMTLLLAGTLEHLCRLRSSTRWRRPLLLTAAAALAVVFFSVQRAQFPLSAHLELPNALPRNPWSQAFLWIRTHTPPDALFAIEAKYVNLAGEDAQTFRATAQRSVLPDFSKDGGEAAITPRLAPTWLAASTAQRDLSILTDAERDARLAPFRPTWIVLRASSSTAHPCPYSNAVVKVCRLTP